MSIHAGQVESVTRAFSQRDFDRFAALSGDDNPIHVDPAFSARTRFGATVAHGMLLYSAVSSVLGTRLPGPGTVQLEQELMFPSPTYAGEDVTVWLEVNEVQPVEEQADLTTLVLRPNENLGLKGRTLVQLPGKASYETPPPPPGDPVSTLSSALKGLALGQRAETRRTFTARDLDEYVDLTGDANPIFTDAAYAQRLGLAGPVVPGSLLGGLFSSLLGTELPGRGTNYLKQRLMFPEAAHPGEELTASVEITRIRRDKELVNLRTVCTNPAGGVVCRGEALVLVRDVEGR
jgi:acyl dehydratase